MFPSTVSAVKRLQRGDVAQASVVCRRMKNVFSGLETNPVVQQKKANKTEENFDAFGHPRIPHRGRYEFSQCEQRRAWAEKFTSTSLSNLGQWWSSEHCNDFTTDDLRGNIENLIGLAKVPVGLVGPLLIKGGHVTGNVLCPFATTEGALIASATRGATAINRSGGALTKVFQQKCIRAPTFLTDSISQASILADWIQEHVDEIRENVKHVSQHVKLVELDPCQIGRDLHMQFIYETGDASGQNGVTAMTWHACRWLLDVLPDRCPNVRLRGFFIETLLSGDKRPSAMNFVRGRGTHVQAEISIPNSVLETVFKVDRETFLRCFKTCSVASRRTGELGFSMNASNAIAAIFTATGQDIACLYESSLGLLDIAPVDRISNSFQEDEPGVYACLVLPSLMIGTVGGGTSLPTQKECLKMMGCFGKGTVQRLAEIIVAVTLALDLSLLAALANGQFATAHERLGRNRPDHGITRDFFNDELFTTVLGSRGKMLSWQPMQVDSSTSILSSLTKRELSKLVGHFAFNISYSSNEDTRNQIENLHVVVKSKATDVEVVNMLNKMAQECGSDLAIQYERHKFSTGFRKCDVRELEVMAMHADKPKFTDITPETYHIHSQPSKDVFVLVMEYMEKGITHLNTVDFATDVWRKQDIQVALRDIAAFHSLHLGNVTPLLALPWMVAQSNASMVELTDLWLALLQHNRREFPQLWTQNRFQIVERLILNIERIWSVIESSPRTLVHNDFNPRNCCIRNLTQTAQHAGTRRLCLYDWELCTVHVPQYDVAEFLAFTLPPNAEPSLRLEYLETYKKELEQCIGHQLDNKSFMEAFDMACCDLAINRLALYTMAYTFQDYQFLPRVLDSHLGFLEHLDSIGRLVVAHK